MSTGRMLGDLSTPIIGTLSLLGYAGVQVFKRHNPTVDTELLDGYTASAVCILTISVNLLALVQNLAYIGRVKKNQSELSQSQKYLIVFAGLLAIGAVVYAAINLANNVSDQAAITKTVFANFASSWFSYFSRSNVPKSKHGAENMVERNKASPRLNLGTP